jgi:hypothetical protein
VELRKLINGNPAVAGGAVVAVVALAGWFVWSQMGDSSAKIGKSAYYTTDDGKTWFVDDVLKVPPFDKDGKPACGIILGKCTSEKNPDPEPKPLYLYRYTAKGKAAMETYVAAKEAGSPNLRDAYMAVQGLGAMAKEVKRPGDKDWVTGPATMGIARAMPTCPPGEMPGIAEPQ